MSTTNTKRLEAQVALVTGGSSGIGKGIAIAMGNAGANVVINYHSDEDEAKEVQKKIEAAGSKAVIVKGDVGKEEDAKKIIATAKKEFGRLDILVNNAGIQQDAALVEMSLEQWEQVINTNLTGSFLCSREAAKLFLEQGVNDKLSKAAGKIIFISSVHDRIAWAQRVNYSASKGGMHMMMETLAQELAGDRIRVNSISPGAIKTDINRASWEDKDGRDKMLEKIPYGRIGVPEDIAKVAVFLASDDADYITGSTIYVDGGMTLYPLFLKD
jgi:glucose 1-dehydrogenase